MSDKSINEFTSKSSSISGSNLSAPYPCTPPAHASTITPERTESISLLDAEIQRADDVISEFQSYRCALSRRRNSLLSVINLPQEILEMIFEWACLPVETRNLFSTSIPRPTPKPRDIVRSTTLLFIASVCSRWRNVALGAQQLWNDVVINCNDKGAKKQAEMLSYWLSKSGQRPLTVALVELDEDEEGSDSDEDNYILSTAVVDALVDHAHRLHTLDLIFPDSWKRAVNQIATNAKQLTRLILRALNTEFSLLHVDLFVSSPQLRDVTLVGYLITNVTLPWAQIEKLQLECSNVAQCLDVLRLCPHVRKLLFDLVFLGEDDEDEDDEISLPSITHNSLEVIEMRFNTESELKRFLEPLKLPVLRSLTSWIDRRGWRTMSIPPLLPFVARSGCKLDRLCLVGVTDPHDLAECLQKVPSLRELRICNRSGIDREVLDSRLLALMNPRNYFDANGMSKPFADKIPWDEHLKAPEEHVYRKGSPMYLGANLETLFIQGQIYNDIDNNDDLVEFLAHRWRGPSASLGTQPIQGPAGQISDQQSPQTDVPVARLRSATLINTQRWQLRDMQVAIVQMLQSEGMYIDLSDRPMYVWDT